MAKSKEEKKKKQLLDDQTPSKPADTETSTMKKKKKEKPGLTVKIETTAENPNKISPLIAYFPSGYDPLKNEQSAASTKLYKNAKRSNRLQLVVSPNNASALDFVGTNYAGEATAAQLCTYSLALLNKDTNTLKILPVAANKIIRLEPRVRGLEAPEDEEQELTAEARYQKQHHLDINYSTSKTKRRAEKRDSRRQQDDTGNQEEFHRNMAGAIKKEALQGVDATDYNSARNIPPHDLAAADPHLAYPLHKIIFNNEWPYLLDVFELTKAGVELTTDVYPVFVCNRCYKLEHLQDEEEKKSLAGIFSYITHLVKFKDRYSMDGVSSGKHHKFPGSLVQKFSSMFDISDSNRMPQEKKDLLISYVLVLTLFADDFRSDPSDIAKDLRINAVQLRPYYEYLGCKFVQEKKVSLATLPTPLNFPAMAKKRKRRT